MKEKKRIEMEETAKNCEVVYEYYDTNTGVCSVCSDACNNVIWQKDVCSTSCAGLHFYLSCIATSIV